MNILLVGHVCIDHNVSEHTTYTSWGSALMYMAAYFNGHTEASISLIAPYGKDFLPYSHAVNLINDAHDEQTLIYKNISDESGRVQSCEHNQHADPVQLTSALEERIAQADIIMLAPLLPTYAPGYVAKLLALKKSGCITALLPQGYLRQVTEDGKVAYRDFHEAATILPFFDLVMFSQDDTAEAETLAKTWAAQNKSTKIILTQGDAGASWVRSNGDVLHVGTTPVPIEEVIDSVGCGDTFSAAVTLDYQHNQDIESAIRAGNNAARDKLRHASPLE